MSSKTTNLNLTKPSEDEFYDINVQNENMDIIDREINGLKQPAYEVSTAMSDLNSGEMITVAFGKIAKAVSTLISHITSKATSSVLGHVKLSDSTSSTSASTAGVAATPKAVKAAYDLANSNTKKIGTTDISGIGDGTVTGAIAENKDAIEDVTQSLTNKDIDLSLATQNCEAWFDNSIDRIGNRVHVNLSVHMKNPLPRGTAMIVAAISKGYSPKAENISFPATSNEGNPLYGYVNKTTGRIYLVSPNSSIDSYITASFSYRAS